MPWLGKNAPDHQVGDDLELETPHQCAEVRVQELTLRVFEGPQILL